MAAHVGGAAAAASAARDLDPASIAAARNQALVRQQEVLSAATHPPGVDEPEVVAAELQAAHEDAEAIKIAADLQVEDTGPPGSEGKSLADKTLSAAGAGEPAPASPPPSSSGADAAHPPSRGLLQATGAAFDRAHAAAAEAGESLAQAAAAADQGATTAARDAVARAAEAAPRAGHAAAAAAAAPVEMAKGLVSAVRKGLESLSTAGAPAGHHSAAVHEGPLSDLASEVADADRARADVEKRQAAAAYDHAAAKLGVDAGAAAPEPDTLHQVATATGSPLIHSPLEATPRAAPPPRAVPSPPRFLIHTPKEPSAAAFATSGSSRGPEGAAAGEGEGGASGGSGGSGGGIDLSKEPKSLSAASEPGFGVGDPAAQAGGVAFGKGVARTIVGGLKEAVGLAGPPPAGPAPPGDEDVEVGDFATLNVRVAEAQKEAVAAQRQAAEERQEQRQETAEEEPSPPPAAAAVTGVTVGTGASDLAPGVEAAALGVASPGDGEGGSSGGGPGVFGLLGGVIADIAAKVSIATSSEEAMAGGTAMEDDAAAAAGDAAGDAGDAAAGDTGGPGGAAAGEAPAAAAPQPPAAASLHDTRREGDAFVRAPPVEGTAAKLQRGWEELKRGGAKAPWVKTTGETDQPQDVTSNVERSRHLDDPQERRIYEAETYKVSPGATSAAADAQAATDQSKAERGFEKTGPSEAVAGDKAGHTGAEPHPRPEGPSGAPQADRFSAGGGHIYSSIGTGSAAPFHGNDAVKRAHEAFAAATSPTAAGGGGGPAVAAVPLVLPGGDGDSDSAGSGGGAGGFGAMGAALSAALRAVGVGRAKDPGGKEMKDEQQLLVREEPASGRMHVVGNTAQEGLPAELTEPRPPVDAALVASKVERLGRAALDLAKGPPKTEEEAQQSLWGKDSGDRPDGEQEFVRRTAKDVAGSVRDAPSAAAATAATAAEIVGGVAEHAAARTAEAARSAAEMLDPRSREPPIISEEGPSTPAEGPGPSCLPIASVGAGGDDYAQQLERLGQGGRKVTKERETLADKILNPMIGDTGDDTKARDLARSYKDYKAEHAPPAGAPGDTPPGDTPSGDAPDDAGDAAPVRPRDRPYDPIGHMRESKEADAAKLPNTPGSDQDTAHLARDSTGRGFPRGTGTHTHATKEEDPVAYARRVDEQQAKSLEASAALGLSSGKEGSEHPAARQARDALTAHVTGRTGGGGEEERGSSGGEGSAAGQRVQAAGGQAGKAAREAAHAIGANAPAPPSAGSHQQPPAAAMPGGERSGREARQAEGSHGGGGGGIAAALEGAATGVGHAIGYVLGAAERVGGGAARDDASRGGTSRGGGVPAAASDAPAAPSAGDEGVPEKAGRAAEGLRAAADEGAGSAAEAARRAGGAAERGATRVQEAADEAGRSAADAAERAGGRAAGAASGAREGLEDAVARAQDKAERAGGRAVAAAGSVEDAAVDAAHAARERLEGARRRVEETGAEVEETARQWGGEVEAGATSARESVQAGVRSAEEKAEGAAQEVQEGAERAAAETRDQAAAAGRAGASLLGGLAETAKAALGAMLGPLEREGAFDESAAVYTGTPLTPAAKPAAPEAMGAEEARAALERRRAAIGGYMDRASDLGSEAREGGGGGRSEEKGGRRGGGGGGVAEAPAGDAPAAARGKGGGGKMGAEERLQTTLDDAAHAAGLAAAHAKEAAAALLPPQDPDAPVLSPYTNTEDILAARAAAAAQGAVDDAGRGPARV